MSTVIGSIQKHLRYDSDGFIITDKKISFPHGVALKDSAFETNSVVTYSKNAFSPGLSFVVVTTYDTVPASPSFGSFDNTNGWFITGESGFYQITSKFLCTVAGTETGSIFSAIRISPVSGGGSLADKVSNTSRYVLLNSVTGFSDLVDNTFTYIPAAYRVSVYLGSKADADNTTVNGLAGTLSLSIKKIL